jgi:DnaJ homolog subfamily C member 7
VIRRRWDIEPVPEEISEENKTSPIKEKEKSPDTYKEQGNLEFKAKNYSIAIDLYSKAIGEAGFHIRFSAFQQKWTALNQNEPNYWNNRAAAYMAQNQFAKALPDVQQAATLQTSSPQPKTLMRLARCHFALGNVTGSINTLRTCLQVDPNSMAAMAMTKNVKRLEEHLKTFKEARDKKDWGVARLALDKCFQECEGPGNEEWQRWKVEMEIVKQRWDSAMSLATYVCLLLNTFSRQQV